MKFSTVITKVCIIYDFSIWVNMVYLVRDQLITFADKS